MGYANYNKAMFFAVHQCHDAHFALFGKTRLLITCHQQQQQQQTIKNSRYIKNEFLPCFRPLFDQPICHPHCFFAVYFIVNG